MAAPALPVARRGKQSIDQAFQGIGRASSTNESISAGVGGRPCRSYVRRRMSVARSATGAGRILAHSSLERMNRSTGVRTQSVCRTPGRGGRRRGFSDHHSPSFTAPAFSCCTDRRRLVTRGLCRRQSNKSKHDHEVNHASLSSANNDAGGSSSEEHQRVLLYSPPHRGRLSQALWCPYSITPARCARGGGLLPFRARPPLVVHLCD